MKSRTALDRARRRRRRDPDQVEPHDGAGDVEDEERGDRHARGAGEQADVVVRRDEDERVRRLAEPPLGRAHEAAVGRRLALHPRDRGVAVPVAEQVEERVGEQQPQRPDHVVRDGVELVGRPG